MTSFLLYAVKHTTIHIWPVAHARRCKFEIVNSQHHSTTLHLNMWHFQSFIRPVSPSIYTICMLIDTLDALYSVYGFPGAVHWIRGLLLGIFFGCAGSRKYNSLWASTAFVAICGILIYLFLEEFSWLAFVAFTAAICCILHPCFVPN
jgi:hypothetical protein